MTHAPYFVVGGVYADTGFASFAEGSQEERYGPFPTYREAREAWSQHAWQTVDDCHARYRILDAAGVEVDDSSPGDSGPQ